MRPLMVVPIVLLALATGFCRGILEQVHPLNADFRKMTILMMYLFGATTVICAALGMLYGN